MAARTASRAIGIGAELSLEETSKLVSGSEADTRAKAAEDADEDDIEDKAKLVRLITYGRIGVQGVRPILVGADVPFCC